MPKQPLPSRTAVRQHSQSQFPVDLVDKHGEYTRPGSGRWQQDHLDILLGRLMRLVLAACVLIVLFVAGKLWGG